MSDKSLTDSSAEEQCINGNGHEKPHESSNATGEYHTTGSMTEQYQGSGNTARQSRENINEGAKHSRNEKALGQHCGNVSTADKHHDNGNAAGHPRENVKADGKVHETSYAAGELPENANQSTTMRLLSKIRNHDKDMPLVYIRFYAVGLLLFFVPYTRGIFISIISLSLLLVIGAVFLFHKKWNLQTVFWFAFILISSFFLEMKGVESGAIFGEYSYDRGLAPMVNGTPLIIGINWLFLVYASHEIVLRFKNFGPVLRIITGSLLMICYDLVMEWVAPMMNMWHFDAAFPPFRNFLVWFVAALVYHSGFEIFGIRYQNLPARALFGLQIAFFAIIGIFSQLFIL